MTAGNDQSLSTELRDPAQRNPLARSGVTLSVVVPLYNEELVIEEMYRRLSKVLRECVDSYELIMVNDGSRDRTVELARQICKSDRNVKFVNLSRNFGHQLAITAGMDRSCGRCVVIIDADLQDPPEVIPRMLEKWRNEDCQVVYGMRATRKGESVEVVVPVSFRTAALGGKVPVELEVYEECATCKGSGGAPGAKWSKCPECDGRGVISFGQGGFAVNRPCPMCLGRGQVPSKPCPTCKGSGEVRTRKNMGPLWPVCVAA